MIAPKEPPPDARDLLRRYDLRPKREFSQNFLIQPHAIAQITEAVVATGMEVVEFGPGLGALTHALLGAGCRVTAVELDRDMVEVLRAEFQGETELTIVEGDAARFDLRRHAEQYGGRVGVTGNLPYQATGAILRRIVDQRDALTGAVLMVQREVEARLRSEPGKKAYGALSVFTQAAFEIEPLMRLRPGSFHPPPKVDSSVVRLAPRESPLVEETESLRTVVRAAFHTRRKTLRNALRQLGDDLRAAHALEASGIDPSRRGETLSIAEFGVLAQAWDTAS